MLLAASAEWLTGFWLISVGVAIGVILVIALLLLLRLGGLLGLSRLADSRYFNVSGLILSVVILVLGVAASYMLDIRAANTDSSMAFGDYALPIFLLLPFSVFVGYGVMAMLRRRSQEQMNEWLTEGVSFWLLILSGIMTCFAIVGLVGQHLPTIRFVGQPNALLQSVMRLPSTGLQRPRTVIVPPSPAGFAGSPIKDIEFNTKELKLMRARSDQRLEFSPNPMTAASDEAFQQLQELPASSDWTEFTKLPVEKVETLYVRNMGSQQATFELQIETQPEHPEVIGVFWSALLTLGLFAGVLFQSALLPKESAISWATFKTESSQPLFAILIAVGMVFLLAAIYIPYNTFGEDIKMYVNTGRPVILLLSVFFAVWASSKSVAEEIDGRTALTVLAKPISRRQFLVGKAVGIGWAVGVLSLILGLWFLFLVSYKPIYDGVEASKGSLPWTEGYAAMAKVFPALLLGYMETMVFVFISVMISTRLPIVSNLMICFALYIIGHLTPLLLEKPDTFPGVRVVGQTITTVIPVLAHFDVGPAIVGDATVPLAYLGWTLLYCILYCGVMMLVALILFEDRDLS